MNYSFNWDTVALDTYTEETEFILLKWDVKEVQKFVVLVEKSLERLSKNPEIGSYNTKFKIYSLLISKQTTLFYNFDSNSKIISLYVFWNNQKKPNDLIKLL